MSVPTGGGYYQTAPQVNFDWLSKGWQYFKQNAGAWVGAVLLGGLLLCIAYLVVAVPTGIFALYVDILKMDIGLFHGGPSTPSASMMTNPFLFEGKFFLFGFFAYGMITVIHGGYYRMALKQIRGEKVAATDFLAIGDVALPLFALGILSYVVIMIAALFCILPEFVAIGLLMFAPLVLVDRNVGPVDAIKESFNLLKGQWLMATLFYFVAALIAGLGFYACGVGALVTYPLFIISIAVGYSAFTQTVRPLPQYGQPQFGQPQFGQPQTGQPDTGNPSAGVWPPPPSMGEGPTAPPSNNQPPPGD